MTRRRGGAEELAGIEVLAGASRRQRAVLAGHVDRLVLGDGTTVAGAGSPAREVVVVLSGVVQVGADRWAGPGTVVDAVAVVDHADSPHDVVARGRVEVLVIEATAFRWAVQEVPDLAARIAAERHHPGPSGPSGAMGPLSAAA